MSSKDSERGHGACPLKKTATDNRDAALRRPVREYAETVRLFLILILALSACTPAPQPVVRPKPDPAKEAWYGETTAQLAGMARDAKAALQHRRTEAAAEIITRGQPLIHKLLAAPRPTLAAMQAVSDLDQLYGEMLLANRHYVWARMLFQKNLTRWTNWTPRTADTMRRLKEAHLAVAECDRHVGE